MLHDHAKPDRHSGHNHSPGAHTHVPADFGRAFVIGIALNAAYVLAETFYGIASHSLALLADAGHNANRAHRPPRGARVQYRR
jgi:cobalt-zinc-cadmium efflux system protein